MRNSQSNNLELPLMAALRKPTALAAAVIATFGDDEEAAIREAVIWAWRERRVKSMSQGTGAAFCGITPQHFSAIVGGLKYLPPHKLNVYQEVVGNTAVSQTIERFRLLREERLQQDLAELLAEQLRKTA